MKAPVLPEINQSWNVTGAVPNPDQTYPHWGANVHVGVVAPDMETAMTMVKNVYPGIKLVSIHHRGPVQLISIPK